MWNIKLIKNTIKTLCVIGLILLFCSSCDDSSNPMANDVPCCVFPPDVNTMSMEVEQNTMMPGELPQPMIVGGTQVNPACPNCKYDFMYHYNHQVGGVDIFVVVHWLEKIGL